MMSSRRSADRQRLGIADSAARPRARAARRCSARSTSAASRASAARRGPGRQPAARAGGGRPVPSAAMRGRSSARPDGSGGRIHAAGSASARSAAWHASAQASPTLPGQRTEEALVLGLPDGVTACLFDLDGVLTDTAAVHDRAWTQTFDAFLRAARRRRLHALRPARRLRPLRRRQAPRGRASGRSWPAAASSCPRARRTTRPAPTTVHGARQPQERAAARADRAPTASRSTRAAAATCRPRADAGLRRAVVSSSANTAQVLAVTGLRRAGRAAGRRGHRPRASAAGQARARHVPAGRRAARRRGRRRRRSSRTRSPGSQAGRAGGFGYVVGVDRVGQAGALHGATAPTSVVADLAEPAVAVIGRGSRCSRSSRGASARRPGPRRGWPRASRCSRCRTGTSGCAATSTRASRPAIPGTYLNSFFEERPLPYAEAGYGYPEDGQTVVNVTNGKIVRLLVEDEPFDVRYGTLHAARAGARPARRHAHPTHRLGVTGRQAGAGPLDPAGVVRAPRHRRDLLRGRGGRADPGHRAVRAGGQRGAAARSPSDPRVAAALEDAAAPLSAGRGAARRAARAPHPRAAG